MLFLHSFKELVNVVIQNPLISPFSVQTENYPKNITNREAFRPYFGFIRLEVHPSSSSFTHIFLKRHYVTVFQRIIDEIACDCYLTHFDRKINKLCDIFKKTSRLNFVLHRLLQNHKIRLNALSTLLIIIIEIHIWNLKNCNICGKE